MQKIAMLDALGVIAYSRVRRAKNQPKNRLEPRVHIEPRAQSEQHAAIERSVAIATLSPPASISPVFLRAEQVPLPVAPVPARPAARAPVVNRLASVRSEWVLPSAEIERFMGSRMYHHFCLLFASGAAIPVVENAVISDTALYFELPPKAPLKLGSMALLRSAWRAKRQAWLAIRLWRKQQR